MDTVSRKELFSNLLALENAIDRRPLTVSIDAPVAKAIAVMGQAFSGCTLPSLDLPLESLLVRQARASCTLMVDGLEAAGVGNVVIPLGIFTQWDALRAIGSGMDLTTVALKDAIARPLIRLQHANLQDIFTALSLFEEHQIFHLPVVNAQMNLVGVVTPESIRQILQPSRLLNSQSVAQAIDCTVVQVPPTLSVLALAQLMAQNRARYAIVCQSLAAGESVSRHDQSQTEVVVDRRNDESPQVLGTVAARDVVQLHALEMDLAATQIQTVMNPAFCFLKPSQSLLTAYGKMQRKRVLGLVMSSSGKALQGIVTLESILQLLNSSETRQKFRQFRQALSVQTAGTNASSYSLVQPSTISTAEKISLPQGPVDLLGEAVVKKDRLLSTMSLHIRQSLDLEEILSTTVSEVRQFLLTDRVSLYRFNPDWSGTIVVESVGDGWLSLLGRHCEDTYFSAKFVKLYRRGRIQTTTDIYTSDLTQCHIDLLGEFQVRAILVVPILQGEELWGLLGAHQCSGPRVWQRAEVELLQQLANHIAIAIQQSELYHQLELELAERKRAEERIAASLREKEVLLKEIHHRVKNNLQVISSLLKLQASYIKDNQALDMFKDSQNRIRSMALVHEKLYQSQDLARIDFSEYVQSLVKELFRSYRIGRNTIALQIEIDDISLNIDTAIPCGLLINELVSNALKHAFKHQPKGQIKVQLQPGQNKQLCLTVSDNGVGFPHDLDFRNTESLGLQLVCTLTEQLEGTVEMNCDRGTTFNIIFQETKR